MIHWLFQQCVVLLEGVASFVGTDYETVNVVVFCVLWPLLTVAETSLIVWLWIRLRSMRHVSRKD